LYTRYASLLGRTVLITGGGSGIGAALVEAYVATGAKVAFIDIQDEVSAALAERLAKGADHPPLFIHCDLVDIAALEAAIERIRRELGPIRVLVNNAGNDTRHATDAVTPDYWDEVMALNLKHQFFASQAVRAQMREAGGGSIVNFSSIAWMRGAVGLVAYTTAKAATVGMTRSLGAELGAEGIRVNAIAPGAVITERQLELWYTEEQARALAERQAIPSRLLPEHIAAMALFLGADDSRMITKQTFIVDAGML
jgi:NAD(P)-dependent dehydrogenase (short-subunit alcohol dehydrogenase family)